VQSIFEISARKGRRRKRKRFYAIDRSEEFATILFNAGKLAYPRIKGEPSRKSRRLHFD
jgi:hypothetical protein